MALTALLCIRSPFNRICIFVGQEDLRKILKDFSIETNVNMFTLLLPNGNMFYPIVAHPNSQKILFEQT
jgi:hypothetical protein